jgi:hypothetical protein
MNVNELELCLPIPGEKRCNPSDVIYDAIYRPSEAQYLGRETDGEAEGELGGATIITWFDY